MLRDSLLLHNTHWLLRIIYGLDTSADRRFLTFMASTEARVTQRAPRSCLRCSTKELRCSETAPCGQCLQWSVETQCRREPIIVLKKVRAPRRARRAESSVSQWRSDRSFNGGRSTGAQYDLFPSPTSVVLGAGRIASHPTQSPSLSFHLLYPVPWSSQKAPRTESKVFMTLLIHR